jgi:hypothetical protein
MALGVFCQTTERVFVRPKANYFAYCAAATVNGPRPPKRLVVELSGEVGRLETGLCQCEHRGQGSTASFNPMGHPRTSRTEVGGGTEVDGPAPYRTRIGNEVDAVSVS